MPTKFRFGPEYLAIPRPETPWLIHSLVPRDGSLLLYSAPKQGKSTALLQLACAISNPQVEHFLGLPVLTHGPVGYLQIDTPSGLWVSEYVSTYAEQLNFDQVAFEDRDTMLEAQTNLYPFNLRDASHALWLRGWCDAFKPVCVIIDTYRELFRGEERDSDLAQMIMATLFKCITPAACILVHHSRKIDPKNPSEHVSEDARGTTYLTGKVDVICQFSRKRWKIQGRGGDMNIKTRRDPDTGLITFDGPPLSYIEAVIKDTSYPSDRARALKLSEQLGISIEAARWRLKESKRILTMG